ncbi:AAA family ATPase [Christiangramia salexigens]|uniref:Rad50/SbcC-type AAA domain-containing protein n=1 Tax=Christiangramia salexigens TaxID=1913577 RepID=A0A1L3J1P0_9FLAO|nr:AAA family ATPase [Christiangramia salexigens]APG59033.1 hypothetical protein LPB144_00820 [Christiangramia salexigens]
MKILKIEFENINSLKGSHEIDFTKDPFTTNSLFAITGPTGSGKSSILDVISLALFNQVPRLGKITKNEILAKGAILTRNQKHALARVTYQSKDGVYSSQWSISTNRNDKLRDYEMEITDHQADALIDLKKSDVPAKNEELIGLNYDQFIKAVLLAQGEFAQFLKAKKEERGELLEKITGTGIYRQLGIKAFEKNKLANQEIQQQQNEIRIIEGKLIEEDDLKRLNNSFQEKTGEDSKLQKEIDSLKKAIELKKNINDQNNAISRLTKEKAEASSKLETFEKEHGAPLKAHEKVQDFSEDLRTWEQWGKEIANLKLENSRLEKSLQENTSKKLELKKEISVFIKQQIEDDSLEEELDNFRKQVEKLKRLKDEKGNEYAVKRSEFNAEVKDLNFTLNEKEPQQSLKELEAIRSEVSKDLSELAAQLQFKEADDTGEKKEEFQRRLKLTREATRDFAEIEKNSRELKAFQDEVGKLNSQLNGLPEKIESSEKRVGHLKTQLELLNARKKIQLLEASLEEHRHQLKDGEPCPLCGAEHHPYATDLPEMDNSLDVEINNAEKDLESSREIWNTHKLKFKNLKERQDELEENIKKTEKILKELNSGFSEKYSGLDSHTTQEAWQNACEVLELKTGKISDFEDQQKRLRSVTSAIPILNDLKVILKEGKELKNRLLELYKGNDIQRETQQFQNSWIRIGEEHKNLLSRQKEIRTDLDTKQSRLSNLEKDLKAKIPNDYQDIASAFQALIPEQECNRLRSQRQQIQKNIDDSQASLKLLKEQLENLKKLDSEKQRDLLETELKNQVERSEALNAECRELERLLKNNDDNLNRLKELRNEIAGKEKETKRWRLLNELIGDSKGKGFNDFAQDLTLSRLIKLANVRLQDLSDRYLIAKPEEEEDDGLVAIDEHMGGQRRSVKTLSGGETFILSLSMALALSDLASKNVEINSLFIDEGFGTLDPETLDQTLDTLERLQAESSKTIGVISHVDSLKERISTQVKLSRNGQGYSSLMIT